MVMDFFKDEDFGHHDFIPRLAKDPAHGFEKDLSWPGVAAIANAKLEKYGKRFYGLNIAGMYGPLETEHSKYTCLVINIEELNPCDHSPDKLTLMVAVSKAEITPHMKSPGALIAYSPAVAEFHCKCGKKFDVQKVIAK
jgi:hypothetical protein